MQTTGRALCAALIAIAVMPPAFVRFEAPVLLRPSR